MRTLGTVVLTALAVSVVRDAKAQSAPTETPVYVTPDVEKPVEAPEGWSYALTLAANFNLASNRDVVGQINGNSVLFGGTAMGGATYLRGRHQLLNTLSINEAWSRTPVMDRVVKSNDLVELQVLYNFFLNPWTGPFARVSAQTSLFKTNRFTPTSVTYVRDDGMETETTSRLRLSDALQPFTLSESAGWFVQPVRSEPLNVNLRAGFGGRHTFADGARAVTDDDGPMITYTVLKDVHQGGAELFAGLDGKQLDGKLLYTLGATALFPLINNDDTDRSIAELTRVSLTGGVGMGVLSWLSINYHLKVLRDPQLVDAVQIQNGLLISLQYTRSTPTEKEAEEEEELSPEAQARIAELEERAAAAEARAAAAEARSGQPASAPTEAPADEGTEPQRAPDPRLPVPTP